MENDEIRTINLQVSDQDGDTVSFTTSNFPAFVSLTDNLDNTAQIQITPSASDVGNYTGLTITLDDGYGGIVNQTFNLQITSSFITTWKTDNPGTSESNQITIPTTGTGYNYTVSWMNVNDPTIVGEAGTFNGPGTVTFPSAGTYQVSISGDFPRIYFNNGGDKEKILSVDQWGNNHWESMRRAFYGCSNLTIPAVDAPDLSLVTDISTMLAGAVNFNNEIGHWDVSNVTNMATVFYNASSFNQPLSNWNISNATTIDGMFRNATSFDQDISGWNVSNVINMSYTFAGSTSFNQDLSTWNVSNVTQMGFMFRSATTFNQDLRNWNVSSVTNMAGMFEQARSFNQDLSGWDVSNVTLMYHMFRDADSFNRAIGNWNVGNVTSMVAMFFGADVFNQPLGSWDVRNVTNMNHMFYEATSFNQDLSSWNVGNVTDMQYMFYGVNQINFAASSWDVSKVTNMTAMFRQAGLFNHDISGWNVSNVTSMGQMFFDASSFNQNIGNWDVSNVANMSLMFENAGLSPTSYNQTLIGWSSLPTLQSNVSLGANGLEYCDAAARAVLTDTYGWTVAGDIQTTNCNSMWLFNNQNNVIYTNTDAKIGINTSAPTFSLDVNGTVNATELLMNGETFTSSWTQNGSDLIFGGTGNVGIGVTNPSEKLTVDGKIHTERLLIDSKVPGPDYVFDKDYQLRSLDDLEAFIRDHGHLPYFPSAQEMEEKGVNLELFQMSLLRTLEEMTLRQIELQEEADDLIKEYRQLKEQLSQDKE